MNAEAQVHFKTLVHAGYSVRVIRRLMKYKGHDLSGFEDYELIREMLKVSVYIKEDTGG